MQKLETRMGVEGGNTFAKKDGNVNGGNSFGGNGGEIAKIIKIDVIPQPTTLGGAVPKEVWRKAMATYGTGACVELAELQSNIIGVRDSKNPTGPVLSVTRKQLGALLKTLKG
jgi:hypothetical protein